MAKEARRNRRSWIEPGILHARAKAGAPMKETEGRVGGGEGGGGVTGGGAGMAGAADGAASGGDVGRASEVRKCIWPDTQSTNGLWRVSQLYPRTAEVGLSRAVT